MFENVEGSDHRIRHAAPAQVGRLDEALDELTACFQPPERDDIQAGSAAVSRHTAQELPTGSANVEDIDISIGRQLRDQSNLARKVVCFGPEALLCEFGQAFQEIRCGKHVLEDQRALTAT